MTEVVMTVIILLDTEPIYYKQEVPSYVVCKRRGAKLLSRAKVKKGFIICEPKQEREDGR